MYMHGARLGREGGHLQNWDLGFAALKTLRVAPLALPMAQLPSAPPTVTSVCSTWVCLLHPGG